jgi:hypothetical protein
MKIINSKTTKNPSVPALPDYIYKLGRMSDLRPSESRVENHLTYVYITNIIIDNIK